MFAGLWSHRKTAVSGSPLGVLRDHGSSLPVFSEGFVQGLLQVMMCRQGCGSEWLQGRWGWCLVPKPVWLSAEICVRSSVAPFTLAYRAQHWDSACCHRCVPNSARQGVQKPDGSMLLTGTVTLSMRSCVLTPRVHTNNYINTAEFNAEIYKAQVSL